MPRPYEPQGLHWCATLFGHDTLLHEDQLKANGVVRAVWQKELAPLTGMYARMRVKLSNAHREATCADVFQLK